MHATAPSASAASAATASALPKSATRRMVDAPTRLFHWLSVVCLVGAYVTADGERWRLIHVVLGYTLAGLMAWRLVYGILGPRQVRWSVLWGKLRLAPLWWQALRQGLGLGKGLDDKGSQPAGTAWGTWWRQGQNLALAASIATLLGVVLPLTLSGYASFNEWGGDWLGELHESMGEFTWLLAWVHVGLVLAISLLRRKNLVAPMWSGHQEGRGPDLAKRNHLWLAAMMVLSVLGYWAWEVLQAITRLA